MTQIRTITTHSPEETVELASRIAYALEEGDLIALIGDLGTGKTMFVKGLAKGLGVKDYIYVNSPSFVVLKEYYGEKDLYHFDVYRLEPKSFCETLDYEKYFYGKGVTVVEWAEKVMDVLPDEYLEVKIEYGEGDNRLFEFRPVGGQFEKVLKGL